MKSSYLVGKREISWGILANSASVGANVALIAIAARALSKEEVALWLVCQALTGLVGLIDFGFQPSITRNVTYVYSGVRELRRVGLSGGGSPGTVNANLLCGVISLSRRIYLLVASITAALLLTGGTWYVLWLVRDWDPAARLSAVTFWSLVATGAVVNSYFGYYSALLQGRGEVALANKAVTFGRAAYMVIGAGALICGAGLVGLGVAMCAGAIVLRVIARAGYLDAETVSMLKHRGKSPLDRDLLGTLWHSASRLGMTFVGAFLIQRSSVLVAATMLGLDDGAAYIFTMQVFWIAVALSSAVMLVYVPRLSMLQTSGDADELQRTSAFALVLSSTTFMVMVAIIILLGPLLLDLAGGQSKMLDRADCVFIAGYLLLEVNHSGHATIITTANRVPFVAASLLSGVAIVAGSIALLGMTGLGIWALLISPALIQASYNNWKWPLENLRALGMTQFGCLAIGIAELVRRLSRMFN